MRCYLVIIQAYSVIENLLDFSDQLFLIIIHKRITLISLVNLAILGLKLANDKHDADIAFTLISSSQFGDHTAKQTGFIKRQTHIASAFMLHSVRTCNREMK